MWVEELGALRPDHVGLLTPEEQTRRAAFRQPDDADRFALGAVLLRVAAARTLGLPCAAVVVDRACEACGRPHGRPRLAGTDLHASVSHSGALVLVATTRAGPVGVDVEEVRPLDHRELLPAVSTAADAAQVRHAGDFFVLWTRKEAVVKATGTGLRAALPEVAVGPPDRPPPSFEARHLIDLDLGAGYAGAVCVLASDPVRFALRHGRAFL